MNHSVVIHYIRPGKDVVASSEELLRTDAAGIKTIKSLPPESSEGLSSALFKQDLIRADQRVKTVAKSYFFAEPFNVLEFRDPDGNLLGYYSDIGEPLVKRADGDYEMTDLFLDTWLFPDGQLIELDWDEFEEAIANQVITPDQAKLACAAMQRLKNEIASGIYPTHYIP